MIKKFATVLYNNCYIRPLLDSRKFTLELCGFGGHNNILKLFLLC